MIALLQGAVAILQGSHSIAALIGIVGQTAQALEVFAAGNGVGCRLVGDSQKQDAEKQFYVHKQ